MRLFKVTACIPCPEKARSQRELQNTFFTKWVPYESWFAEQQRIMKQGTHLVKKVFCSSRWERVFSGQGMQAVTLKRRMG